MSDLWTPTVRAIVVVALLLATTALVFVAFATARAAGTFAAVRCGAYWQIQDLAPFSAEDAEAARCAGRLPPQTFRN